MQALRDEREEFRVVRVKPCKQVRQESILNEVRQKEAKIAP